MGRAMKMNLTLSVAMLLAACGGLRVGTEPANGMTIDHTNFDPARFSDAQIQAAAALKVYYEHASTGQDIVGNSSATSSTGQNNDNSALCGLAQLYAQNHRYLCSRYSRGDGYSWKASDWNGWFASHTGLASYMRGNPSPQDKVSNFFSRAPSVQASADVLSFKFCWIDAWPETGIDGAAFAASVISQTESFESSYPGKIVLYWTMPVQTNESYAARDAYNAAIRTYCEANGRWLLDIADIESHNDSGVAQRDGYGREIMYSSYATSDGGHLASAGRLKMAKAYWSILAEIAIARSGE